MALDDFLLNLLVDPVDHEALLYVASAELLVNPRRKVAYRVDENIAVLLPDEAVELSDDDLARYQADPHARLTGPR
ncbi:MAG: Trm112 family protein [Acidobacteriota bacterium]|nr:Trm112 family protein [Acidobacteriota bacterium]MDE3223477.1 Trm112 family protein [Acidobacteriota bacterium]